MSAKPAQRSNQATLSDCWSEEKLPAKPPTRYFEYLPIGLFASVMGLAGLSIAWRLAAAHFAAPHWISDTIGIAAAIAFIGLLVTYGAKSVSARDAVQAEFAHPIARNLFGMVLISLLLMAVLVAPLQLQFARGMWIIGAVGVIGFAWLIVSRWMRNRQQVEHATPAWMVPIVGLLNVPLAVPSLALPQAQPLVVACMAIGLFFAIPLFTMIFSRLLFEEPLPDASQPMLLILIAPFAVGFSASVATTGRADLFAESLYWLMIFLLAILLGRLRRVVQCCPFRMGWWAVGFPLAASATAAIRFAAIQPSLLTDAIAITLLGLASLVIAGLALRTIVGILRGELRALSG